MQRDADALSAERLSRMTGEQLQGLLSRPVPLPAQEQRAALLREASQLHNCLSLKKCTLIIVHPCFRCLLFVPAI